jgi:23S rRNA (uracil1939-C5)-methyltransferase
VLPLDECLVAATALAELVRDLRVSGTGEVSVRVAEGGQATVWVNAGDVRLRSVPQGVGVGPEAFVVESIAGAALRVSAPSFFQSGPHAAEALVGAVRRALGGGVEGHLIDAYGGVGLFAATVEAGSVTVVESASSACADARHNVGERATIVHSSVETFTPTGADVVLADPSRRGLGRAAADVLAACGAPTLVLVSCDPVAMARDARLLVDHGYVLRQVEVLDLFAQTPHVEVVSLFTR